MKVEYVSNTCDLPDWEYGEQLAVFKGDEVVFAHDHSDDFLDVTDSVKALKAVQKAFKTKEDIEYIALKDVSATRLKALKKAFNV